MFFRRLRLLLIATILVPGAACSVLRGHTVKVVQPKIHHHTYYDHAKDRKKKRTKIVRMEG